METYHLTEQEKGNHPRKAPPYTSSHLRKVVLEVVKELYQRDYYLIERRLSERTLTIRLAMYLQEEFPDYDIDGEYNRNLDNPKFYTSSNGSRAKAEPDVLVHQRGHNHPYNLIAVEAKRKGRGSGADRSRDRDKLRHFVDGQGGGQDYLYQLGVFVDFGINEFDYEFFEPEDRA